MNEDMLNEGSDLRDNVGKIISEDYFLSFSGKKRTGDCNSIKGLDAVSQSNLGNEGDAYICAERKGATFLE